PRILLGLVAAPRELLGALLRQELARDRAQLLLLGWQLGDHPATSVTRSTSFTFAAPGGASTPSSTHSTRAEKTRRLDSERSMSAASAAASTSADARSTWIRSGCWV